MQLPALHQESVKVPILSVGQNAWSAFIEGECISKVDAQLVSFNTGACKVRIVSAFQTMRITDKIRSAIIGHGLCECTTGGVAAPWLLFSRIPSPTCCVNMWNSTAYPDISNKLLSSGRLDLSRRTWCSSMPRACQSFNVIHK